MSILASTAAPVATGLAALSGVALALTVAWALLSGTIAAWLGHRYDIAGEGDDEHAVLGDATCPHCAHVISFAEAAPVRNTSCAACSWRLPASWLGSQVTVLAGCLTMLATFGGRAVVLPFMWLVPVLVTASVVDLRTMLIPKRVAWVGFGGGIAAIVATAAWLGATDTLTSAFIGSAAYFGVLAVMHVVMPSGMGFGDVRLALLLGLYLGWIDWRLTLFGLLIANVVFLAYALPRRLTASQRHSPFGPALAAGTLIAIAFYPSLLPG